MILAISTARDQLERPVLSFLTIVDQLTRLEERPEIVVGHHALQFHVGRRFDVCLEFCGEQIVEEFCMIVSLDRLTIESQYGNIPK